MTIDVDLDGSIYLIGATGRGLLDDVERMETDVARLRRQGTLTTETLRAHFGATRFDLIAESNALEGSTLNAGETELAVLSGVTISGHDPAYVRDARTLSAAMDRVVDLARGTDPTDIDQVREIHGLILGDRQGAGTFRTEPVTISGSAHRPPRTWAEVMTQMEDLETWSRTNAALPALVRASVLHTWLTHIHPFLDGNGRTARAVLNLELIRSGYPVVTIRKKDRRRYLDALGDSDTGGDLAPIMELILARARDGLRSLERAAHANQGYDAAAERLRDAQERQRTIWNDSVKLLASLLENALSRMFDTTGDAQLRWYDAQLSLDDFVALSQNDSSGNSWLFRIDATVPAVGSVTYLAWAGFRSERLRGAEQIGSGPSIFWSVPDPEGMRPWRAAESESPGGVEITLPLPNVDRWIVARADGRVDRCEPSALVRRIATDIESAVIAGRRAGASST